MEITKYACGHESYHHCPGHEKVIQTPNLCNACYHALQKAKQLAQLADPLYHWNRLHPEEKKYLNIAYNKALLLDAPFLEREILAEARANGYELKLAMDPRFVKLRKGQGYGHPPLWGLASKKESYVLPE